MRNEPLYNLQQLSTGTNSRFFKKTNLAVSKEN